MVKNNLLTKCKKNRQMSLVQEASRRKMTGDTPGACKGFQQSSGFIWGRDETQPSNIM